MFGNLGEMAKMMSKVKDIQSGIKKLKSELGTLEFSATSAGGRVKATVSGDFVVKSIEIAPEALKEGCDVSSAVTEAVNSAVAAAKMTIQTKMTEISGGIDLPGLF
ncbi:MAG: YbaB/EbfC family nucleoid-associated protein [Lentisphaeria bacterium]|nr:YbaB/EbfC family nucleoid-associated protein [Lentisphaeria bacterium]